MSAINRKISNERNSIRMNDKRRRASYSGRHPELSSGTPVSLRELKPTQLFFNEAVDPLLKKQHEALRKTEAKRREENGSGSQMVKLHKPFPELKPKFSRYQLKKTFNSSWVRERERAAMELMEAQNSERNENAQLPTPIRTRSHER